MTKTDRSLPAAPSSITSAYAELVRSRVDAGWSVHLLTFMFRPLAGSPSAVLRQMHREVERVFAIFAPRVVRKPCSPTAIGKLPILLAFADLPVFKNNMPSLRDMSVNGGLHLHGLLLVPPVTRLKVRVEQHFIDGQAHYAPSHRPLVRVHVVPITTEHDFVVDYSAKGLRSRRFDHDDSVLILPRSASELR